MSLRPALLLAALGLLAACDQPAATGDGADGPAAAPAAESSDALTAEVQRRAAAMCDADPARAAECAPVVACFGETGPALVGRSYQSEGGRLYAEGPSGITCAGDFLPTMNRAVARVQLSCSNGQKADFQFRTSSPGTLRGEAVMEDGTKLEIWSGRNMWRAFEAPGNAAGRACVKAGLGL
ncbi:hypothetical protein [Mangrovicoccus algicola]|uniref:C-type lysozyme inhibitor domain-containing protein n=1 Tax=Mangrovicoccus algicola TaxID=2771008 RepID=A0A8J7CHT2_9RHOB|nr:hypothetical protein [Mangrovicoccus algicola]MBE3638640.1 hypothetical protein [Mangrovicoccus algicola]